MTPLFYYSYQKFKPEFFIKPISWIFALTDKFWQLFTIIFHDFKGMIYLDGRVSPMETEKRCGLPYNTYRWIACFTVSLINTVASSSFFKFLSNDWKSVVCFFDLSEESLIYALYLRIYRCWISLIFRNWICLSCLFAHKEMIQTMIANINSPVASKFSELLRG